MCRKEARSRSDFLGTFIVRDIRPFPDSRASPTRRCLRHRKWKTSRSESQVGYRLGLEPAVFMSSLRLLLIDFMHLLPSFRELSISQCPVSSLQ